MGSLNDVAEGLASALIATGMATHGLLGATEHPYGDLLVITGGVIGRLGLGDAGAEPALEAGAAEAGGYAIEAAAYGLETSYVRAVEGSGHTPQSAEVYRPARLEGGAGGVGPCQAPQPHAGRSAGRGIPPAATASPCGASYVREAAGGDHAPEEEGLPASSSLGAALAVKLGARGPLTYGYLGSGGEPAGGLICLGAGPSAAPDLAGPPPEAYLGSALGYGEGLYLGAQHLEHAP